MRKWWRTEAHGKVPSNWVAMLSTIAHRAQIGGVQPNAIESRVGPHVDDDTHKVNFEEARMLGHRFYDQNTGSELDPKGSGQRGKRTEAPGGGCREDGPNTVRSAVDRWQQRGLKYVRTAK